MDANTVSQPPPPSSPPPEPMDVDPSQRSEAMDIDPSSQTLPSSSLPPPSSRLPSLRELRLPSSFKITAPQINEVSHMRRAMKRREIRLKHPANRKAQQALRALGQGEQVLRTAQTMAEIDSAHDVHRSLREDMRAFGFSKARLKDQHNQRLRTRTTWARLAAAERRYVQEHARRKERNKPRKH